MKPFINGQTAPEVDCARGLRQGRIDSMRTFCCLMCFIFQDVLKQWHRLRYGFQFGDERVCMVSYADDIVLVCNGLAQVEAMLAD
eukprot:3576125-Karenia_brevis.AAC.1